MAEDSDREYNIKDNFNLGDRRNRHRRSTDSCVDTLPECAGNFANLEVRVQTLEKNCEKTDKRISLLHNSIAKLYQLKNIVVAWAIAAGTIASFIYSNLATIKHLFF